MLNCRYPQKLTQITSISIYIKTQITQVRGKKNVPEKSANTELIRKHPAQAKRID